VSRFTCGADIHVRFACDIVPSVTVSLSLTRVSPSSCDACRSSGARRVSFGRTIVRAVKLLRVESLLRLIARVRFPALAREPQPAVDAAHLEHLIGQNHLGVVPR
jgi:hypothetical protein